MPKNVNAEQMREHRFEGTGIGIRHGQKPISVNLPDELDRYVRSKENRSAWVRAAVEAAARAEGWMPTDEQPQAG
jgi:hypothetical protein